MERTTETRCSSRTMPAAAWTCSSGGNDTIKARIGGVVFPSQLSHVSRVFTLSTFETTPTNDGIRGVNSWLCTGHHSSIRERAFVMGWRKNSMNNGIVEDDFWCCLKIVLGALFRWSSLSNCCNFLKLYWKLLDTPLTLAAYFCSLGLNTFFYWWTTTL